MTEPACQDPTSDIVQCYLAAVAEAFDPASECPPIGGPATAVVRLFGGDGIPLSAWESHSTGDGCAGPFLWVRLVRRYRSSQFPMPDISVEACGLPRVAELEIGVGRCAVVDLEPSWEDYAREAEVSLDDSWRIELALCRASGLLRQLGYTAASGEVMPYGPEGGVIAWTGIAYAQF